MASQNPQSTSHRTLRIVFTPPSMAPPGPGRTLRRLHEVRHTSNARGVTVESPHRGGTPVEEVTMVTREAPGHEAGVRRERTTPPAGAAPGGAAAALAPVLRALIGADAPVRVTFWDGSAHGPEDAVGTLAIHTPDALRRIVWAPGELGVARAFVAGDLSVDGDIFEVLTALRDAAPGELRAVDPRTMVA